MVVETAVIAEAEAAADLGKFPVLSFVHISLGKLPPLTFTKDSLTLILNSMIEHFQSIIKCVVMSYLSLQVFVSI